MILQVTRNVMTAILSLPAGDIYNLSVTACTERGSNTSTLHLVKLGKMSAWRWQWGEHGLLNSMRQPKNGSLSFISAK